MERGCSFRSIGICLVMVVLLVLFIAGVEKAIAAVSWKSAVSGNWNDGTKWDTGFPPSSVDDAVIALDGTYTVTLNVDATINSLTLGGTTGTQTLAASGRTLTINGASTVNSHGALSLSVSIINGSGMLTNQGTLTLLNSTVNTGLTNGGTLIAPDCNNTTINGALINQAGGMLRVDAILTGWSTLTVADGTNHGTIELTSTSGAGNARLHGGALTNASDGVINVLAGSGGLRYLKVDLTNQGMVTVSQTLAMDKVSAVHANSGTIQVNENVTVNQSGSSPSPSFTNSGTISVAGGKKFQVNGGGFTHSSGGTWSGAGSVGLHGVTMTLAADFSEAIAVMLSSSTVNGPGRIWTNGTGGVLTLLNITVNTGLTNGGTLIAPDCNNTTINGALINQAGGMLRVDAILTGWSTLTVADGTNHGTIELTSTSGAGNARLHGGALTNASDGVINVLAGSGGLRYLKVDLTNQGMVTVSQTLAMDKVSAVHANSGTINVASGKTMTVSSGTFTNAQGGILQGTGTINVSNATFSNAGNINPGTSPGILTFTGNVPQTSTGAIDIEIGGLTVGTQYDRVSASGTVTFAGSLNVSLVPGFSPSVGDSFTIVTYASRAGTFGITNLPPLTGGKAWSLSYNATSAVLAVQAVQMYSLTVSPSGTGSGTVNGNGINCAWNGKTSSGTCSVSLAENTAVSLSVSPTTGSTFAGWTGGSGSATSCSGTGACAFNITATSGVDLVFTMGVHIYLPLILRN